MAIEIRRFGVFQTAKILGTLYMIAGILFAPLFMIVAMFSPEGRTFGLAYAFLLPIVYGIIGFITTAIGCAIYNFIAGMVGGIEVEFAETSPQR